jgi:hypothetical protein
MTTQAFPSTHTFRGLNNVADPQRLGLDWLVQADNVDITQTGAMQRCRGFTRSTTATAISGAYGTKDLQRLYVVDSGVLKQVQTDMSSVTLRSGLSAAPMYFEEINGQVFFTNGVDYGIALDGVAKPWGIRQPSPPTVMVNNGGSLLAGVYQVVCTLVDPNGLESSNSTVTVAEAAADDSRLTITNIPQVSGYTTNVYVLTRDATVFYLLQEAAGASATYDGAALGRELPFWNTDTPRGTILAFFQGQMYVAEAFPANDVSAIWRSLPLHYHHFDPGGQGLAVPGAVRMLVGLEAALIIGTDRQIFAYDGEAITELAPYGVVPGWHASKVKVGETQTQVYFWSLRGLCHALPFSNLTETTVSVPPGLSAGGTVVEKDGMRRYVVALHSGGEAFNRRIT